MIMLMQRRENLWEEEWLNLAQNTVCHQHKVSNPNVLYYRNQHQGDVRRIHGKRALPKSTRRSETTLSLMSEAAVQDAILPDASSFCARTWCQSRQLTALHLDLQLKTFD